MPALADYIHAAGTRRDANAVSTGGLPSHSTQMKLKKLLACVGLTLGA
jgi:hypothetical protein